MSVDLFGQIRCTPGQEARCRHAKSTTCTCDCGGKNHGIERPETIEKAARLTRKELAFINRISLETWKEGHRPLVYMALCSAIIGNVIRGSDGILTADTVVDLVKKGIE